MKPKLEWQLSDDLADNSPPITSSVCCLVSVIVSAEVEADAVAILSAPLGSKFKRVTQLHVGCSRVCSSFSSSKRGRSCRVTQPVRLGVKTRTESVELAEMSETVKRSKLPSSDSDSFKPEVLSFPFPVCFPASPGCTGSTEDSLVTPPPLLLLLSSTSAALGFGSNPNALVKSR